MATRTKSSSKLLPVFDIGYASHVGGRRDSYGHESSNEDSIAVHPAANLLRQQRMPRAIVLVADGMGGGAIGRTLSSQATLSAIDTLRDDSEDSPEQQLKKAFEIANHSLVSFQSLRPDYYKEGGSTLVAALMLRQKDHIVVHIGNIGDSRAYLLKANKNHLELLTRDHNRLQYLLKEEGMSLDQAQREHGINGLTHRLGRTEDSVRNAPEFYRNIAFYAGDRLMLCTDGLSGLLDNGKISEQEIVNILHKNSSSNAANKLTKLALQRKTADNVSVAVIQYGQSNFWGWLPNISWKMIIGIVSLIVLVSGALFILNTIFNQESTLSPTLAIQGNQATVTPLKTDGNMTLLPENTTHPGQPTSTFDLRTATPTATQTPSPTPIPPTRIPPTRILPTRNIPNVVPPVPTNIPTNTLVPTPSIVPTQITEPPIQPIEPTNTNTPIPLIEPSPDNPYPIDPPQP